MKSLRAYKDDLKRIGWYLLWGIVPISYVFLDADKWQHQVASGITFCFVIYVLFKRY